VLYRRPALFVTCDRLRRWLLGASIDNTAAALGKTPINLDRRTSIDFERELRADERAYRAYTNAYIEKGGTEDRPFWMQVADRIERLLDARPAGTAAVPAKETVGCCLSTVWLARR